MWCLSLCSVNTLSQCRKVGFQVFSQAMNLHQWHSNKRERNLWFDVPSANTTKKVAEPPPSSASVQEGAFGSESHVERPKPYRSRFVLGLSPTVYGVTASHAKKKEGLNLAHKPGDLGAAFARSSSIPFYYSVSTHSDSCQSPRDIEDLKLHRKTKHFPSSLPSRKKQSAWDECHWFFFLSFPLASFLSESTCFLIRENFLPPVLSPH